MRFNADTYARDRDTQWVDRITAHLPWAWIDAIKREWRDSWAAMEPMRQAANLRVCMAAAGLMDAQKAGLRPDANDFDIVRRARVFARHYTEGIDGRVVACGFGAAHWACENMARHGMAEFWPHKKKRPLAEVLARLKDEVFWRRVLRRVFARTIEACSIELGLVNKDRDPCVSKQSIIMCHQRDLRNDKVLGETFLENEFGQQMSIKDLASKGQANKNLRLAEMMTRISGMDAVASELGHEALFITVTCPSRMHKFAQGKYNVRPNKKADGTLPDDAHKYLCDQFEKLNSALGRVGVERYGFRVVEPHHDGAPHWHLLIFYNPVGVVKMRAIIDHKRVEMPDMTIREYLQDRFLHYFLRNDSPTERGAAERRVLFEDIDRKKGSAAAYIAKYISKNTNGFGLEYDLLGQPIVTATQQATAWARTWKIRQFQQVGGVPVGPWRELRRVNPEAVAGLPIPVELQAALDGVNIGQKDGARWADGYKAYVMAQGGACVSRKHLRIKVLKQETGEIGRYGGVKAPDVIGVQAAGHNLYKPKHLVDMLGHLGPNAVPDMQRPAFAQIETERGQWRAVAKGQVKPEAERSIGRVNACGEAVRTWTRVNNSTRLQIWDKDSIRDVAVVTRSKTGNFRGWMGKTDGTEHEQSRSSA